MQGQENKQISFLIEDHIRKAKSSQSEYLLLMPCDLWNVSPGTHELLPVGCFSSCFGAGHIQKIQFKAQRTHLNATDLLFCLCMGEDLSVMLYCFNFLLHTSTQVFLKWTFPDMFWLLCCSVLPSGGHCRTTVALWPVFWGVRPAAAASHETWMMLLFLTFLTWVASHLQEAEAAMWAVFLLGLLVFPLVPSFLSAFKGWVHSVFVSEGNFSVYCGDDQLFLCQGFVLVVYF